MKLVLILKEISLTQLFEIRNYKYRTNYRKKGFLPKQTAKRF